MALTSFTIWEVQTGGDDTNNGGAFDPSQTAGMFTDGASTSSTSATPNFSSASYNFVSNDVGAWIYIASGTNWIAGWYKITAVSSNVATLNAAIGAAVLKTSLVPNTVQGVGATASATWTIDYSQGANSGAGPAFTYLDLLSAGAGLTVSSALKPFGKQQVGNSIVITGGTNFNTGRYVIVSVGVGPTFIATVVGPTNITTGAGLNGVGSQGGALASPGLPAGLMLAGQALFIKTGTYSITSASTNISGGCVSPSVNNIAIFGYSSVRRDRSTAPILQASAITTATLFTTASSSDFLAENITVDGVSASSLRGFALGRGIGYLLTAKNCTNSGFTLNTNIPQLIGCVATGCSTQPAFTGNIHLYGCEAYSNTVTGFNLTNGTQIIELCLSYANSGASSDGFTLSAQGIKLHNCISYGNGRHGFNATTTTTLFINCISEGNGTTAGKNYSTTATMLINCAGYNGQAADTISTNNYQNMNWNFIAGTSTFFVSAAGGNFALNNISTGGALLRSAGFPSTFPAGTSVGYLDIGAVQARWPMMPMNIMKVG